MDCVKEYEALPFELQFLVEQYTMELHYAGECFDTLLGIYPEKECSIRALAEAYASWKHGYLTAREQLVEKGLSDKEIEIFSMGYWMKRKNK